MGGSLVEVEVEVEVVKLWTSALIISLRSRGIASLSKVAVFSCKGWQQAMSSLSDQVR